jgi:hypothetical protein
MFEHVFAIPEFELVAAFFHFVLTALAGEAAVIAVEDELGQALDLQMLADPVNASENFGVGEAGAWAAAKVPWHLAEV